MTGSARDIENLIANEFRSRRKAVPHLFAKALRAALTRAGFAIVPVEPTEAMLAARDGHLLPADEHKTAVLGYWQAMLSAARQQEAQDDG